MLVKNEFSFQNEMWYSFLLLLMSSFFWDIFSYFVTLGSKKKRKKRNWTSESSRKTRGCQHLGSPLMFLHPCVFSGFKIWCWVCYPHICNSWRHTGGYVRELGSFYARQMLNLLYFSQGPAPTRIFICLVRHQKRVRKRECAIQWPVF